MSVRQCRRASDSAEAASAMASAASTSKGFQSFHRKLCSRGKSALFFLGIADNVSHRVAEPKLTKKSRQALAERRDTSLRAGLQSASWARQRPPLTASSSPSHQRGGVIAPSAAAATSSSADVGVSRLVSPHYLSFSPSSSYLAKCVHQQDQRGRDKDRLSNHESGHRLAREGQRRQTENYCLLHEEKYNT